DDLEIELVGQLAAEAQKPFIAILAHPAGAAFEGNIDEIARGIEHRERRDIVERVERRLARELPVAAEHLPLIFAAPDRLAEVARLHEAVAGGDTAFGGGHDFLAIGFVAEAAEPDQLELPRSEPELV